MQRFFSFPLSGLVAFLVFIGEAGSQENFLPWPANLEHIPERPIVQDNRRLHLTLEQVIRLELDEYTPVLGRVSKGRWALGDSTFFFISDDVYEFDRTGTYIRTIGRQGSGPGEYQNPTHIAVDAEGRIYVVASPFLLHVYDRTGRHLHTYKEQLVHRLFFDQQGNLVQLMEDLFETSSTWRKRISQFIPGVRSSSIYLGLTKRNRQGEPLYRLAISTDETIDVLAYMSPRISLCYSVVQDRFYYVDPWDYKIKVIDAHSGQIIEQFGPEPEYYHSMRQEVDFPIHNPNESDELFNAKYDASFTEELHLLAEKYVLYKYRPGTLALEGVFGADRKEILGGICLVYDISSGDTIRVFQMANESLEDWQLHHLDSEERGGIGGKRKGKSPSNTIAQEYLYVYKPPPENMMETSNGRIEIFSVSIPSNEKAH